MKKRQCKSPMPYCINPLLFHVTEYSRFFVREMKNQDYINTGAQVYQSLKMKQKLKSAFHFSSFNCLILRLGWSRPAGWRWKAEGGEGWDLVEPASCASLTPGAVWTNTVFNSEGEKLPNIRSHIGVTAAFHSALTCLLKARAKSRQPVDCLSSGWLG